MRDGGHEVVVSDKDGVLTPEELRAALSARPYDGVVSLLTDTIDASLLEVAPNVKIVANYAVGFNNIAVQELTDAGVTITNTPGVLTDTVAEYTASLIMAVAKRIPEADRFARAGKYEGWAPELLLGSDLMGKTLGIIGAGRIGSGVAKRMRDGFVTISQLVPTGCRAALITTMEAEGSGSNGSAPFFGRILRTLMHMTLML